MTTIQTTPETLKAGLQLATTKLTTVQLNISLIEILIGGPYKTEAGEDHPFGHAALRVITKNVQRIYDFGRYGKTRGLFGTEGEGILRVWSNFGTYITSENITGRTTTGYSYEVSEEKSELTISYFNALTTPSEKRNATHPDSKVFKLKMDYDAINNNCVTTTLKGARLALPTLDLVGKKFNIGRGMTESERNAAKLSNFGWPSHIFMPEDLRAMLEDKDSIHPERRLTYKSVKV